MEDESAELTPGRTVPCPECGASDVAGILYGMTAMDGQLEDLLKRKRVTLGGCMVYDDAPTWACNVCGHRYGRLMPYP